MHDLDDILLQVYGFDPARAAQITGTAATAANARATLRVLDPATYHTTSGNQDKAVHKIEFVISRFEYAASSEEFNKHVWSQWLGAGGVAV